MAKDQLTAKQALFARLYASGRYSKIKAYEEAGYMPNGKRQSRQVEAQKLSRRPHVAEAIEAYQDQLLPLDEMKTEKLNAIRNIKMLAYWAKDERVRLASSKALYDLCNEWEKLETVNESGRSGPADIEKLLDEILKLGKANNDRSNSLTLETYEVSAIVPEKSGPEP
jgi:hypothetical protein